MEGSKLLLLVVCALAVCHSAAAAQAGDSADRPFTSRRLQQTSSTSSLGSYFSQLLAFLKTMDTSPATTPAPVANALQVPVATAAIPANTAPVAPLVTATPAVTATTSPTSTPSSAPVFPPTPTPNTVAKPGGAFVVDVLPTIPVNSTGIFNNPILFADFADPDVIRVNDTFYMAVTSMHMVPGSPILRSYDLVNWEFLSYAVPRLNGSCYSMENNCTRYGLGPWANSLRYNNGTFYVLYNINDQGAFLSTATNASGPWTNHKLSWAGHDPGLLFDTDGRIYMSYGQQQLTVVELDKDFNQINGTAQPMMSSFQNYPGIEGSHLYKIDGWYYNFCPWGGGWGKQIALRSSTPLGPYEPNLVFDDKMGYKDFAVHQGGLVDTPYGEWWSVLMQDRDSAGRIDYLQPVNWTQGWPFIGVNGKGVFSYQKPAGLASRGVKIQTSDEFSSTTLGLQWQWNHNPNDSRWSLTERPGYLRLKTAKALSSANLTLARNQLTQRVWGPQSDATVALDASGLVDGDTAGLSVFQNPYGYIAVRQTGLVRSLVVDFKGDSQATAPFQPLAPNNTVFLKATFDVANQKAQFSYSYDNATFTNLGPVLQTSWDVMQFVGYRYGLFIFNTANNLLGVADFNWFRLGGNVPAQPGK